MKTETQSQPGLEVKEIRKVWTPDAELSVPFGGHKIIYAFPSFGPNTYRALGKQILDHNLAAPIGDQEAALLCTAYCGVENDNNRDYNNDIKSKMNSRWIVPFQVDQYSFEGVHIVLDPNAEGLDMDFNMDTLE